ncbi:ATP-dependent sacrificial sulfur transferase LarE [Caloramator sp. E03]|uniref:ATP-dependent sacrificial sulfur transferase LarE n=1 Tax=Caloramator sp. E03 TaxID=2576307 RepID=UPI001110F689|nr:ATP-dependent sacrificial sulfur transferase LarE [Caloramator sp. E03]QCX34748.1 ATP-dependent sacrificial sulfur transferase LarE [Caloramator sp. E03]
MSWENKYLSLTQYLNKLEKIAIAFSGGMDSSLLLKAATDSNLKKVVAITINTPYIPSWEIDEAKQLANELKIRHRVLNLAFIDEIKFNPENRCYLCKKSLFKSMIDEAKKESIEYILDGTNTDDLKDYRPGIMALKELNIKSPLLELGFTKKDIREILKNLNLSTWDKKPNACLLSRIPYGEEINLDKIKRIEESEKYILNLGFDAVRVRSHGDMARIEVPKNQRKKFFDEKLLDEVANYLKNLGFKYVSIDIEGYRTGSLNEAIK